MSRLHSPTPSSRASARGTLPIILSFEELDITEKEEQFWKDKHSAGPVKFIDALQCDNVFHVPEGWCPRRRVRSGLRDRA